MVISINQMIGVKQMNNQTINELIELARGKKELHVVGSLVDDYFDAITFSLEKTEWDSMGFAMKVGFVDALIKQANKWGVDGLLSERLRSLSFCL